MCQNQQYAYGIELLASIIAMIFFSVYKFQNWIRYMNVQLECFQLTTIFTIVALNLHPLYSWSFFFLNVFVLQRLVIRNEFLYNIFCLENVTTRFFIFIYFYLKKILIYTFIYICIIYLKLEEQKDIRNKSTVQFFFGIWDLNEEFWNGKGTLRKKIWANLVGVRCTSFNAT